MMMVLPNWTMAIAMAMPMPMPMPMAMAMANAVPMGCYALEGGQFLVRFGSRILCVHTHFQLIFPMDAIGELEKKTLSYAYF
ncbi:unnamed protein product [Enterobius vermicularis]|uniref:Secreted protein n=1 Tax=Enterobius vermicularis TaxID=51028 RepID=A0A0N4VBT8_ENTVE|nr:unnamed protein product [Enterobius vermicularis]